MPTEVVYKRCPQKVSWRTGFAGNSFRLTQAQVLKFYESHLKWTGA